MIKRAVLLLPAMVFFSLFLIAIIVMGRLSLFEVYITRLTFVGFGNYREIFSDPLFIRNLVNTFIYVVLIAGGQTGGALLVALAIRNINKAVRGASMFILYIPTFTSGVIITSVWRWIYSARGGFLNWLLGTDVIWLLHRFTAIPAISMILIISGLGFYVIVFTVSLAAIDREIIDAAMIDGARSGQVRRYILLPMIRSMILLVILLTSIGAFLVWSTLQWMEPAAISHNLMFDMYTSAFTLGHYGIASAKSVVLVVLVVIFAVIKRRIEGAKT